MHLGVVGQAAPLGLARVGLLLGALELRCGGGGQAGAALIPGGGYAGEGNTSGGITDWGNTGGGEAVGGNTDGGNTGGDNTCSCLTRAILIPGGREYR